MLLSNSELLQLTAPANACGLLCWYLQHVDSRGHSFSFAALLADVLVFHGAREEVLPFFESAGFKPPPRKGIADFLQEVTSRKDQQVPWLHAVPAGQQCITILYSDAGLASHTI